MYIQVNVPRNGDHINPFYPSLVVSAPASYGDSNVKAHFFWLFMGLQDPQSPISCKWPVRFFIGIIALYAKKNRGDIERYVYITANGYTCLEKLTTEKCKQQAKQPEKKILKIKILWKFSLQYLS